MTPGIRWNNYNQMEFTPEQAKKGVHLEFIAALEKLESSMGDRHFDILRTTDGYCTIVLWCEVHDDDHYDSGTFRFVDSDECVMIQREYPDGHCDHFRDEREYEASLAGWLKENPGWSKDAHDGRWLYSDPALPAPAEGDGEKKGKGKEDRPNGKESKR